MNKMMARASAVAVVLLLVGCASASTAPEDNFYRLAPKPVASVSGGPMVDATVEVSRFVADGSVSNRPLLYSSSDNPNAVSEYHYHFWIEAPPTLIKDALVSYLRAAGTAKRVVTPEMRVNAEYSIFGRIQQLEILNGNKFAGRAAFEMGLRRNSDGELLVLNEYEAEVIASDSTVGGAIIAVEKATEQVFASFVKDIQAQ